MPGIHIKRASIYQKMKCPLSITLRKSSGQTAKTSELLKSFTFLVIIYLALTFFAHLSCQFSVLSIVIINASHINSILSRIPTLRHGLFLPLFPVPLNHQLVQNNVAATLNEWWFRGTGTKATTSR